MSFFKQDSLDDFFRSTDPLSVINTCTESTMRAGHRSGCLCNVLELDPMQNSTSAAFDCD